MSYTYTNRVLLIYTGGTIGMGRNPKTDALEPLDFNHLIENLPEFKSITTQVDVYQFTPAIDSSDMNPRLWAHIVRIIAEQYEKYDGFVVLHGTDTMAFTASALSYMLENLTKPVILTVPNSPSASYVQTEKKILSRRLKSRLPIIRTEHRSCPRYVSTSAGNSFAATVQRR